MWTGIKSTSAETTMKAGVELAGQLPDGKTIALHGDLGSGKTTFIKGLAIGLGLSDEVTSPTFALVNEYGSPPKLYHIDCYRELNQQNWVSMGIMEYFETGAITAIEWAETIADLLPQDTLHLHFQYGEKDDERIIEVGN